MNDILIVRHAIAEERSTGKRDRDRQLTDKGVRRFVRAAAGLKRLGFQLDEVFHSPWTRAVQTAELLAAELGGVMRETGWLAQAPDASRLPAASAARVALVGHEPWMGDLASLLATGTTDHNNAFPFKKGGVMFLQGDIAPAAASIIAAYPPRTLRALASSPMRTAH